MTATGMGMPKWALLVFGGLSVVAGVVALAWPGITILTLVILLGIQLIIYGVMAMMRAFETGQGRILAVIFGVLAIMAGRSGCVRCAISVPSSWSYRCSGSPAAWCRPSGP